MSEGFFSRWAKRKEAVREGKAVEAEPLPQPPPQPSPAGGGSDSSPPPLGESQSGGAARQPPPTLEDVQSLTPQDDFGRFVQADVPADVKNAAMKKLFADPRFNVMDGLDVYIDDYGKPDPLPPEMMKKLASAQFLKLFDEDEDKDKEEGREVEDDPALQTVAQSGNGAPAVAPGENDADPDLRLQQDHAPGPPGPGQGAR